VIKFALPTGDLRGPTANLIRSRGLVVDGYGEGSRQYRSLPVTSHENVRVRVFRERDIPMQVALGNYDIGIASLAWVMEMQVRFPQQPLVPIANLGIGGGAVWAAMHPDTGASLEDLGTLAGVRIASDTPNIAESFARAARLRRYRVQAVRGAAEAYPPEDADLVIVTDESDSHLEQGGLVPLLKILDNSAWLVVNAESLAGRRLHPIIGPLTSGLAVSPGPRLCMPGPVAAVASDGVSRPRDTVRLAIPDGHQKPHVVEALKAAGLKFRGYDETTTVRRPETGISGLEVKVIRPQDMPQLVALGEFDLAVTGRDLMREHLFEFPSSPVVELVDLQRAQYNLSAVVDGDLPVDNIDDAIALWRSQGKDLLTVAAEFPATADHYARSRHFWRYQVVPIAGASEGFVPEDADVLIEGTETGKTIAENNLKVIDTLYRSTTCVIGRSDTRLEGNRRTVYEHVLSRFSKAGGAPAV
jgi:ATP phosphoribosyltransferase